MLSNNEGTVVANIGDIIVFTADNRNNTFGEISYETVTEGSDYILRISLSAGYLSDPDTHYPIYIDPTITVAYNANNSSTWNDIEDITVNQNAAADSPSHVTLYAGKGSNTYGAMRAVMRFPDLNLYGIIPSNITSAGIFMRDVMCYSTVLQIDCYGYGGTLPTGSFTTSNMTWSGINSEVQYYESSGRYRATNNVGSNNGINSGFWYEFDILPVVREWAQGTNAGTLAQKDQAVVFKSTDTHEQGSVSQYVCFGSFEVNGDLKPYLTITYLDTPISITLNHYSATILAGETLQLTATTTPSGLTVSWYAIPNYVASVSTLGLVTGIGTGTVTITAQCPGASASCTVSVIPLADGVYRIQNLDNNKYLTDGGNWEPVLSNLSGSSRSQMWLIKNVSGTIRYTLNPLSCTTLEYSGTDYGLFGGYDEYDTGVYIDSISNGSTSFSYGEWIISGNTAAGFRIISYAADDNDSDYDIMVRNSSGNGVELEYEENIIDEEDPVDLWNISLQSSISYTALSSSVNSLSSFQSGKLNWLPFITSVNSNAADQRAVFHSQDSSKVAVSEQMKFTITVRAISQF